jgi:coenzyme Q-binding protein COQ10
MLSIEYAFRNPVYGALSAGAAPRVAETMIRAFEARAREVLGEPGERLGPGMGGTGERGWMEGVVKR